MEKLLFKDQVPIIKTGKAWLINNQEFPLDMFNPIAGRSADLLVDPTWKLESGYVRPSDTDGFHRRIRPRDSKYDVPENQYHIPSNLLRGTVITD